MHLAKKIKELSRYLHTDLEVKTVFTPTPMVSFRNARKIRDYLLRYYRDYLVSLHSLEQNIGSRKYNKRRFAVYNNIESTYPFSSSYC